MTPLKCKYIKFTNGENIICLTDDNFDNLSNHRMVAIMEPMLVSPLRFPRQGKIVETYILHPWMPVSDEKVIEISTIGIISAVEARQSFREQYEEFIDTRDKGLPDSDTTDEDLDKAQAIIKHMFETQNEDEDDEIYETTGNSSRRLH
jgi:glucuronate isomerase